MKRTWIAALACLLAFPVAAATFNVNDTADVVDANPGDGTCATAGNVCTLRAAIQEANALAGDDDIVVPAGTYMLTIAGTGEAFSATGDLNVRSNMTITGAGMSTTVIQAGATSATGIDQVFDVSGGMPTVTLSDLTIGRGNTTGSGGGIYALANLTLQNVEVIDNVAGVNGGAIFLDSGGTLNMNGCVIALNSSETGGGITTGVGATLTIDETTFINNEATVAAGGAMWIRDGSVANVTDSAFIGNSGTGSGAAILLGTGSVLGGTLTLTNCTVSGHVGGAVLQSFALTSTTLQNVTIADNSHGLSLAGTTSLRNTILAYNGANNCAAAVTSAGNNLSDDASCAASFIAAGDLNNIDPLLSSPAALHPPGTTRTHALSPSSPAVDAGSGCAATDQRGVARPQGAACDIGAFELEIVAVPGALRFQNATYSVVEGTPSIIVTVERTGGSDGTVTVDFDTDDGTATAPADYATQSGSLTFNDGVTTQTIAIPIVDDGVPEGNHTFTVRIFNAGGGATIDTPDTTTVTISDPAVAAPTPIPTLSEWGLIFAIISLALLGVRRP